jgi:tRNA (Thr-GGU) A37 N-methylase
MTIGFELEPIGYVKNDVQDVRFKDWKNLVSCLVIDSRYAKALDGLEEFSHLLVITRLHLPGRVLLKRHPGTDKIFPSSVYSRRALK